jgi:hypothetical protein
MYPYHNRIKQRIRNGELKEHKFVVDYPNNGEALVLTFSTYPHIRPIRPHRYAEYLPLLNDLKEEHNESASECERSR